MEKGNYHLKTIDKKRSYSYSIIQSLMFDKIFRDEYDLKVSTRYTHAGSISINIGVGFQTLTPAQHFEYKNESSEAVRTYFNKLSRIVSEVLPDEMPTNATDRGFFECKKIVYKLLAELEEKGELGVLVDETEKTIISNEKNRKVFDRWADNYRIYIDDKKSTGQIRK